MCFPCSLVGVILVIVGLGQIPTTRDGTCTATGNHECERRSAGKSGGSHYRPRWKGASFNEEQNGCKEFFGKWEINEGECNKQAAKLKNQPIKCTQLEEEKSCYTKEAAEDGHSVDLMPPLLIGGYVCCAMAGLGALASCGILFMKNVNLDNDKVEPTLGGITPES